MKLKTLLLIIAMLCVALFVVACASDQDTTTGGNEGTPTTAATTTVATTKATTTKVTTTKATTVITTTTIPTELYNEIPAKLPNDSNTSILYRYGFEGVEDFLEVKGNFGASEFSATGAVLGNGFRFNSLMSASGSARRGEAYISFMDAFTAEGITGVMWHIDFSGVEKDPSKPLCTSITFNTNNKRSNLGTNASKGYYYLNGAWVETHNVNACRMEVPDKFKGWVYVPIDSYTGEGELYDGTTKTGLPNYMVTDFRVYTDGYVYSDTNFVTVDELLYLK